MIELEDYSGLKNSPRLAIHAFFDPNFSGLQRALQRDSNFEAAVGLVLDLCGLKVASYGNLPLNEQIDILTFMPDSPTILLVECTAGTPTMEKLAKLHRRARGVESLGLSRDIIPALATMRGVADIPRMTFEEAERQGVILLSQEDLQELLRMARRESSIDQVVGYFTARQPRMF